VTQVFHNGQPSHGGDQKTFEVMTSTLIIPLVSSNSSYNCVSKADTLLDGNYPYHGKGGIAIVYKSNLIKIRLLLYRLFLISGDTLTFINIPFGFISGFIFQATNHR
jgi:hypothetical protein